MALQLYSARYWLPNGNLSANRPANVFPELSNIHASLFADQAGTIPLPNPLSTDGGGLLTFWAAPGTTGSTSTGDVLCIRRRDQ